MNLTTVDERITVLKALSEGMSIRGVERLTGIQKRTITRLMMDVAVACADYQDRTLRNLSCKRLQADEIWSFCYSKQRNVPKDKAGVFGYGDVWTWTAIDADTKLIPCWLVGNRDAGCATAFISDLASRLKGRVQLTTDGLKVYIDAVEDAFGGDIDYAILHKQYAAPATEDGRRYSPAAVIGVQTRTIQGDPEPEHVSTSFVERHNRQIRQRIRRYTRLTDGFSKKVENHAAATAFFMMVYNFVTRHGTTRVTPAMAAGVSDHVWSMREVLALADDRAGQPTSTYKPGGK